MHGPAADQQQPRSDERRPRRGAVLAGLAVVGVAGAVLVATQPWDDGRVPAGEPTSVAATAAAPERTPSADEAAPTSPAASAEPTDPAPTDQPAGPAPLPPLEQRWLDEGPITSDTPLSDDTLQDGAFVAVVSAIDADARTITADVVIFYGGDAARAAAEARDPGTADEAVNNDYYVVNDVERVRVLEVAADARIGTWCFDEAGSLRTVEVAFDVWAAPPEPGETTACGVRGWPLPSLYWLDVRSGAVAQVTEQYVP